MSRINELLEKILPARKQYYNKQYTGKYSDTHARGVVPDDVYDSWVAELTDLDPTNEHLSKVGAEPDPEEWKLLKHDVRMLSLDKVHTPDDMLKWLNDKCQGDKVLVQDKLDGLSVELKYVSGKLTEALTRNDGINGFDIRSNVVKMQGVKENLGIDFTGSLLGEILLTIDDYKKHFPTYSNPRAAASGVSKRLDGEGNEHLTVKLYNVSPLEVKEEQDKLYWLKSLGLLTPNFYLCDNFNQVVELWNKYQDSLRDQNDCPLDGLVVVNCNIDKQNDLGSNNHHPLYAMAFKFEPEKRETVVDKIDFQVGNTGRITGVAIVRPVQLAGTTVSRATLHNISFMRNLGVGPGSTVLIKKAGDIIPQICYVISDAVMPDDVDYPKTCPVCGTETEFVGEYLICPNTLYCKAQVAGRIKHWVNKLNLLDLGETLIERLVESGKVNTIADLYKLTKDDLLSIERMGERSSDTVLNVLNNNKELTLEKFLGSLSIPTIGETVVGMITGAGYNTLEEIMGLSVNDFLNIQGLGPVKANNLYNGLIYCKDLIDELLTLGVKIMERVGGLLGKSFCFTGTLASMKRAEAAKLVVDNGGVVKNTVSNDLTYLVLNDLTTVKAKKALKNGTICLSEEEFLEMVGYVQET